MSLSFPVEGSGRKAPPRLSQWIPISEQASVRLCGPLLELPMPTRSFLEDWKEQPLIFVEEGGATDASVGLLSSHLTRHQWPEFLEIWRQLSPAEQTMEARKTSLSLRSLLSELVDDPFLVFLKDQMLSGDPLSRKESQRKWEEIYGGERALLRRSIATALIQAGASRRFRDDKGFRFIHHAAYADDEAMITALLHGASTEEVAQILADTDTKGYSALHFAAIRGHQGVRLLLEWGAPFRVSAVDGLTPLHLAAANPDLYGFWQILQRADDPIAELHHQDGSGFRPVDYLTMYHGGESIVDPQLKSDAGQDLMGALRFALSTPHLFRR